MFGGTAVNVGNFLWENPGLVATGIIVGALIVIGSPVMATAALVVGVASTIDFDDNKNRK